MKTEIIYAIGKARISTDKQSSGASLDEQIRSIEYFSEKKGAELLMVDKEIYTGTKRSPVYEKHLKYIKNNPNKVKYYIVHDIDRLTRAGISSYHEIKQELADLGVTLIDTKEVIQEKKNLPELENLGFEYEWGKGSSGEITEAVLAMQAEEERKKILQRTIPKQILYTQSGYKVRSSIDGYNNEKVLDRTQMRTISVPDPKRSFLFIKMFELRAEGKLTDEEIVDEMNNKYGYTSKNFKRWSKIHGERNVVGVGGGKLLTVKQLQRIIQRVGYAGFISEKWTKNKPVKAQWDGLVSVDIFNRANRGKVFLQEQEDGSYEILHNYKEKEKKILQRHRYRKEFPFKGFKCPSCGKPLLAAFSKGKGGKKYPYYYCAKGHKQYSVRGDIMENQIDDFLSEIKFSKEYIEIFEEVLEKNFEKRVKEIQKEKLISEDRLQILEENKSMTIQKLITSTNPSVTKMLEDELSKTQDKIEKVKESDSSPKINKKDISELIEFSKKIVENPIKTLKDKENPLRQYHLLSLIFDEFPSHSDFISRNHKLSFVFKGEIEKSTTQSSTLSQLG